MDLLSSSNQVVPNNSSETSQQKRKEIGINNNNLEKQTDAINATKPQMIGEKLNLRYYASSAVQCMPDGAKKNKKTSI